MEDERLSSQQDEAFKHLFPSGFGKKSDQVNREAQFELSRRNQDTKSAASQAKKNDLGPNTSIKDEEGDGDSDGGGDDSSSSSDSDEDLEADFPISHELVIRTHEKAVTTLACDASGSRLVSGSTDCTIKLHDFASMTPTTIRAFKSVDPSASKSSGAQEVHPIHHVSFNPISPSSILVVTASAQAKVFSRDGEETMTFVKGDMYLRDMHNTKGHVSEITSGAWSPTDMNLLVTGGTDSTLRIWDINNHRSQRDVIVHKSRAIGSGGRTRMTAATWASPLQGGPNILVGAALDGSLAFWSGDGPFTRPAGEIRDAHEPGTITSGVAVSPDGRMIVTRGGDDTIKLWDTRNFKKALSSAVHTSTSSQYPTSNIAYSPTGTSIVTGSSDGSLHILNPATLRPEVTTVVTAGHPLITVCWHERLNQIVAGSADGSTRVLYRPGMSLDRGAAMVMARAPKRRHIDDDTSKTTDQSQGLSGDAIITPGGILDKSRGKPLTGLTASGKSRDPRRPHVPIATPFSKSSMDEEAIRNTVPLSSMRDEDPREALLKYADKAKNDPMFTNAWKETQPETVYAELSDDEEEDGKPKRKRIRG